ncbi:uncharacterized protein LOC123535454 [Mercenaria mercenaria]|uniref:uncharacterized protein LOC123535454 n=1 Tax=Mercenaria mercenaria TaxID=6596 RepID=UPI00234EC202|nr:uncharacterized protein LOC123535454 [Mercenaria mercenaria]
MEFSQGVYIGICLAFAIKVLAKDIHFGHSIKTDTINNMDVYIFEMIMMKDIKKCIESCKTRKACKFFNFDHQAKLCYLIGGNNTVWFERKPGFSFGNKTDWDMTEHENCGNCSDYSVCKKDGEGQYSVCLNSGCGPPGEKNNTIFLGNMFSIGDKIKYECKNRYRANSDVSLTSTCLTNGTWSPVDFECVLADYVYKLNNTFYQHFPYAQNWDAAQETCSSIGGYLIDITSPEEQNFIEENLRNDYTTGFHCYWTGGKLMDGVFQWLDGTSVNSYTNWNPGDPCYCSAEQCLGIDISFNYKWNDKPCTWSCNPLCEIN